MWRGLIKISNELLLLCRVRCCFLCWMFYAQLRMFQCSTLKTFPFRAQITRSCFVFELVILSIFFLPLPLCRNDWINEFHHFHFAHLTFDNTVSQYDLKHSLNRMKAPWMVNMYYDERKFKYIFPVFCCVECRYTPYLMVACTEKGCYVSNI